MSFTKVKDMQVGKIDQIKLSFIRLAVTRSVQ